MAKKKSSPGVKKPTQTQPPVSAIVESECKQAAESANSLDYEIKSKGWQAVSTFRSGNSKKALEMIRESIFCHQDSPHLHCLEAYMHHGLAAKAAKGTSKELKHLTNAAHSAELALLLLPNSVECGFLFAAMLYKLAVIHGREWDKMIEICERMLKIENPDDMLKGSNLVHTVTDSFLENEKVGNLNKKSRIEGMMKRIMTFLQDARSRKNHKLIAMKAKGEEMENHMIEGDEMGLKRRKKQIEEIIKELKQQEAKFSDEKFEKNVEKVVKYVPFWSSALSSEEKKGFLEVKIKELKRHLKSLKNHFVVETFLEALRFAKEHRTWKFLECFVCLEKFGDLQLCKNHFWQTHLKNSELMDEVKSLTKVEIGTECIEMIENGVWKPVDTDKAIDIIVHKMKSDSSGTANSERCTWKGSGMCKYYVQGTFGDEYDENWPLCDDSERLKLLERIQRIFLMLLQGEDMGRHLVFWVIEFAVFKFEDMISSSQILCHSPKTPKVICILGASQLKELLAFVKDLIHTSGFNEYSDLKILIKNHFIGLNIQERVVFNGDLSCLLLDERLLREELNNAKYYDVNTDGSSVTSAADMCKDNVLPESNDIVSWLYLYPSIGEYSRLWTRLRDSKRGKGKEVLVIILEECTHLTTACSRISELFGMAEAVHALESLCNEEFYNREQLPEHVAQPYVELLRKQKKYLQVNDDIASKTKSDMISRVLKEAGVPLSSDLSGVEECNLVDAFKLTDNCILLAVVKLKKQMLKNMSFVDATILRRVGVLQTCNLILENLCLYDYQSIIVPLLNSFLQTHLEDMFDKDAMKKYDAKREAYLAELEQDEKRTNKGSYNVKQKKNNKKNKKKKKNFRKAEESKAKGSDKHFQLPQKEAELDNKSNSTVSENAKELIATEERELEAHMEQQRQFELEASLRVNELGTGFTNEASDVCSHVLSNNPNAKVGENSDELRGLEREIQACLKHQMQFESNASLRVNELGNEFTNETADMGSSVPSDNPNAKIGENSDELKELEREIEACLEHQGQFQHDANLGVNELGTGFTNEAAVACSLVLCNNQNSKVSENADELKELEREIEAYLEYQKKIENEGADSFINMILQSLWHLREFREEFMSRSLSFHQHIGNPCIICALYEMFEALSLAFVENRGDVPVAPTSLRTTLIAHKEGKMKDASEFLQVILESLHESFNTVTCGFQTDDKYEGSFDCSSAGCFVHRIFGMDHYERIYCVKCAVESGHRKYTSFSVSLNAYNLRNMKNAQRDSSFDVLLKLVELNRQLTCGDCGQITNIYHNLWCLPHVFTIVIGWQRDYESSEDISVTLSALSAELDLCKLFQECQPGNIYFLVSMVCYSRDRKHYMIFVYNHVLEKYVQYNGTTYEVIGSWDDVISSCNNTHLQPKILFFLHKSSKHFGITVKDMTFKEALDILKSSRRS